MNAKVLLSATLAGALTLFAWETISNAALPWHRATMRAFADSNAAVAAIRTQAPVNGLYLDGRGVIAAVSFRADMGSRASEIGPMLGKQIVLDVVVALVLLLAMGRLPAASAAQYSAVFAVAAFAVSLSTFVGNWNWYGYPGPWTMVQVVDRTIGFALMGLAMGAVFNRGTPRVRTDEWGGVRAPEGLSSRLGSPTSGMRS